MPKMQVTSGPLQVHSMIEKLAQSTDIRTALVVGGLSMQVQASTLKTSPEIVVATPVSDHTFSRFVSDTCLCNILLLLLTSLILAVACSCHAAA